MRTRNLSHLQLKLRERHKLNHVVLILKRSHAVAEVQTIVLQRISTVTQRPFRLPEVAGRDILTIAHASDSHHLRATKRWVGNAAINPSSTLWLHYELIMSLIHPRRNSHVTR